MQRADYEHCSYGWGIDWMFVAHAYAIGAMAVMDPSVRVMHRIGQGYSAEDAAEQMALFLEQMTREERIAYKSMADHLKARTTAP